jgi:hypothetical protein
VRDLADAWAEVLGRWRWSWFCTLTFRHEVHPEAADKLFRVWVSKMNRCLYGPRWAKHGKGLTWIRALEIQRRGVIHFHCLIAGAEKLHRLTWMDEWNRLAGYARIQPPESSEAVRRYCAKYVLKGGEIDFGGPGMPSIHRSSWPARCDRSWWLTDLGRVLARDQVERVTSESEREQLRAWPEGVRAPREVRALLSDVRGRVQDVRLSHYARNN